MPGIPGDMPGEPGIPGIPPNCAAAGQSGTTASTHANGRARLSVITVVPGRPIRPLDPAAPPINSPLNSAITRQNSGPGGAVLAHPTLGRAGGPTIVYRHFAFWFLNCRPQPTRPTSAPMPRCDFRA